MTAAFSAGRCNEEGRRNLLSRAVAAPESYIYRC